MRVEIDVPVDLVEAVAARAAELVVERLSEPGSHSPWMTVSEAAVYLACSRQRIYDLTLAKRLPVRKDGSRSLYRRDELDAYLDGVAPRLPHASRGRMSRRSAQ